METQKKHDLYVRGHEFTIKATYEVRDSDTFPDFSWEVLLLEIPYGYSDHVVVPTHDNDGQGILDYQGKPVMTWELASNIRHALSHGFALHREGGPPDLQDKLKEWHYTGSQPFVSRDQDSWLMIQLTRHIPKVQATLVKK